MCFETINFYQMIMIYWYVVNDYHNNQANHDCMFDYIDFKHHLNKKRSNRITFLKHFRCYFQNVKLLQIYLLSKFSFFSVFQNEKKHICFFFQTYHFLRQYTENYFSFTTLLTCSCRKPTINLLLSYNF